MDDVIGRAAMPLHRYTQLTAPMDDVLLQAAAAAAGTDIAFSNGWRYGAPVRDDEVYEVVSVTGQGVSPKYGRNRAPVGKDAVTALLDLFEGEHEVTSGAEPAVTAV